MSPASKENLAEVVCEKRSNKKRARGRRKTGNRKRQTDRSCCKLLRENINFIAIIKFNKYNLYATERIKANTGNNPQKETASWREKERASCGR